MGILMDSHHKWLSCHGIWSCPQAEKGWPSKTSYVSIKKWDGNRSTGGCRDIWVPYCHVLGPKWGDSLVMVCEPSKLSPLTPNRSVVQIKEICNIGYPLVIWHKYGKSPFLMGKSIRHGHFPFRYICWSLPEGIIFADWGEHPAKTCCLTGENLFLDCDPWNWGCKPANRNWLWHTATWTCLSDQDWE